MVWLILISVVALLGGLIAYFGDVVGRRVGRKHLRLFGLRPKTTGLVVAVASGVLVGLLSVALVALVARDTVENVSRAQEIRAERDRIKSELENLNTEYDDTQGKLELAQSKQKELEAKLKSNQAVLGAKQAELLKTAELKGRLNDKASQLELENKAAREQNNLLAGEVRSLEGQTKTLREQRAKLGVNLRELGRKRDLLSQRLPKLEAQIKNLAAEKQVLEQRLAKSELALLPTQRRLGSLEAQIRSAKDSRQQVQEDLVQLQADVNGLTAERASLEIERSSLERETAKLKQQNLDLEKQLAERDENLAQARAAAREASRGNFIFREGELIVQLVVPDGNPQEVRARLAAVLKQAGLIAEAQGAARGKLSLKPNNDLEPFVSQAIKLGGPDLVMVRASRNLSAGLEVPVTLDIRSNRTLYLASQPIRARELSLGTPEKPRSLEEVQASLSSLLRETIADLRIKGVPYENIPFTTLADDEIRNFAQRLRGLTGSVWVSVASKFDVLPSGPLEFYFDILR